ncbi:MFS transporter [Roseomonas sp. NAR14]|uniref:MFS transporter n=1 Tax=Roseomonas acroporae TaxID=2937791 RepID=A0A9X1Y5J7_9PROT|nr:MFS transporter [Roseomonas acroporae]MCK8783843.1 MFS transporter [Roseomonas acroporae]
MQQASAAGVSSSPGGDLPDPRRAPPQRPAATAFPHERGNLARLAIGQALAGANASVIFATGAVVGNTLATDKALATLPITMFVVGTALATLPAGAIAQRHGRRAVFMIGSGCGVLVGLLAALAVLIGSFWLFCLATMFGGAYLAVTATFRFAAAECGPAERRARALSLVMAGGLFAGIIGPQLVTHTMMLWPPYLFAATFVAQAVVAVLAGAVLYGVRLPLPKRVGTEAGRPLGVILRQPRLIAAMTAGVVSYFIMNWLMTSAPLAMRLCGLSQADANLGIQWHVLAMYGPSFGTGWVIARIGAPRVVAIGLLVSVAAAALGLSGLSVWHFWGTLVLIGLGWNFGFVGASAMVLDCYRPEERTRVQSLNDFAVFGSMVVGSFISGGLLNHYGWAVVCLVSIIPLLIAAATLYATTRFRTQAAPARVA